jgi:acyl carrier protein
MSELDTRSRIAQCLALALRRSVGADEFVERSAEERWDSLSHAVIMFSIEDAFGIKFSENDLQTLANTDDLFRAVEKHLEARTVNTRSGV